MGFRYLAYWEQFPKIQTEILDGFPKYECYHQTCKSTPEHPCGVDKVLILLKPLLDKFSSTELQLFQYERVKYTKADGATGSKYDQVETKQALNKLVDLLNARLFGKIHKQPYVQHKFKMLLATKLRQEIHENLSESDIICYTDYSKELECGSQEQIKSGMYGASNVTKQLIGQIFELRVILPSAPISVSFDIVSQTITFEKPLLDGGSRIIQTKMIV